jgi:uroporphyrinogen decarboxylase
VLLLGNELDSRKDAIQCLDLGGKKGFILAPGCDLPMETPVANLKAVAGMVYDKHARQVIRKMKPTAALQPMNLEGHFIKGQVVIDIITLDSASCAPCQYMVEAVKKASVIFNEKVVVNEHKIKDIDGIRMMMALGVQNLPTTCINGRIAFISHIPPKSEIEKAIREALL